MPEKGLCTNSGTYSQRQGPSSTMTLSKQNIKLSIEVKYLKLNLANISIGSAISNALLQNRLMSYGHVEDSWRLIGDYELLVVRYSDMIK